MVSFPQSGIGKTCAVSLFGIWHFAFGCVSLFRNCLGEVWSEKNLNIIIIKKRHHLDTVMSVWKLSLVASVDDFYQAAAECCK